MVEFPCEGCGLCCKNLPKDIEPFKSMHTGDGICSNLNQETNRCKIYMKRPLVCNIEAGWIEIFSKNMTWDEWVAKNKRGCAYLRDNPD